MRLNHVRSGGQGSLCAMDGQSLVESVNELLPRKVALAAEYLVFLRKVVTWLILPVVICLSQRLSHACLSINQLYGETANGSLNQL